MLSNSAGQKSSNEAVTARRIIVRRKSAGYPLFLMQHLQFCRTRPTHRDGFGGVKLQGRALPADYFEDGRLDTFVERSRSTPVFSATLRVGAPLEFSAKELLLE